MKYLTIIGAAVIVFASCQTAQKETNVAEVPVDQEQMAETTQSTPLQDLLDEKREKFNQTANPEKKRIYAEGIESVKLSGITKSALQVGEKAYDFTLQNAQGNMVTLYEELKKGPVILTWYRGGWCPYCNITLHYLQQELPNFKAEGAQLIALTPEHPDSSLSTIEKNALQFEVLSDLHNDVARKYGVVFKLTDDVAKAYQESFDLHAYNGDETDDLPMAATYVIDQQGFIRYAFLHEDYRNRAEPTEILKALHAIHSPISR